MARNHITAWVRGWTRLVTLGLALATLSVQAFDPVKRDDLTVTGEVREAPPGAPATAGYLTLQNDGPSSLWLERVEAIDSDGARVELHTTEQQDGISRMRPLTKLELPVGETVAMQPGGIHLMIWGVQVAAGEQLRLRLHFSDGGQLALVVPVRKLGGQKKVDDDDSHHHHHMHH